MNARLSPEELVDLVRAVFEPRRTDRGLGVLADFPDAELPDNDDWRARRLLAAEWVAALREAGGGLGLDEVLLVGYRNARRNNAELPAEAWLLDPAAPLPATADGLAGEGISFEAVYERCSILLAPTELSATAPLKLVGKRTGLRAATMPGFGEAMVPALRLDYRTIDRRCRRLKELLDPAEGADLVFEVDGRARHELHLDLRHRSAHASGGIQREIGSVGNLPSGETYIVPYEGEQGPTRSAGALPVQLGDEVVLYRIEGNVAVEVTSSGPRSDEERRLLAAEPAYGNLAELGFGVLAELGVAPCGELLLDEKLGLHVAFGRSDHFGGQVGPARFTTPAAVVHIDRVYIPETQPRVTARSVTLRGPGGAATRLMEDGRYVVDLG